MAEWLNALVSKTSIPQGIGGSNPPISALLFFMNNDFQNLISKDKYQVFVFSCPAGFPFIFARHPWFVINKKGIFSRWEIFHLKNVCKTSWGHLHLNGLSLFQGIAKFPFMNDFLKKENRIYWKKIKFEGFIEGDENSKVPEIIEFIEKTPQNYPYNYRYSLTGPNSNTYAQYILNKFPEFKIKLDWNFFGKNFKIS